jgi:uncharacterized membrane-anchored protein YjiN (DUF445 family)
MKNNLGAISLLIAFLGLVLFEVLLRMGLLTHQGWQIAVAGFEAATIGGFADWFAVSALFREIPIPFVRKHTNIIAKNRAKLTEGIVDLVTNKWLSPEIIAEKLHEVDLAKTIITFLQQPKNQENVLSVVQKIGLKLANDLDSPKFAEALQKILKEQLATIDLASPLGTWLTKAIKNGDHHKIWELLIDESAASLATPATKQMLLEKLEVAADAYAKKGILKKTALFLAEKTGGINLDEIATELLQKAQELLTEAKDNPMNPIRSQFDTWILEFADKLTKGDEKSLELIQNLKDRLMQHVETEKVVHMLLVRSKETLTSQLENKESPIMQFMISNLNRIVADLEEDEATQERINIWIRETVSDLLVQFHSEIGNMVRSSMMKLNNKELVAQIEEKVGSDLQYIRLNGAVVGGLVGVVIALLKLVL